MSTWWQQYYPKLFFSFFLYSRVWRAVAARRRGILLNGPSNIANRRNGERTANSLMGKEILYRAFNLNVPFFCYCWALFSCSAWDWSVFPTSLSMCASDCQRVDRKMDFFLWRRKWWSTSFASTGAMRCGCATTSKKKLRKGEGGKTLYDPSREKGWEAEEEEEEKNEPLMNNRCAIAER